MSSIFETMMLICFGISWPISLIKHIHTGSTKGMSIPFTVFIIIGYVSGIISKMLSNSLQGFVAIMYFLNLIMVTSDLVVYFINLNKDRSKESKQNVKSQSRA